MKKFATELAAFLRRYYPEASVDGTYRFSADIQIRDGVVDVEIPILTRLPDADHYPARLSQVKSDPLEGHLPRDDAA